MIVIIAVVSRFTLCLKNARLVKNVVVTVLRFSSSVSTCVSRNTRFGLLVNSCWTLLLRCSMFSYVVNAYVSVGGLMK